MSGTRVQILGCAKTFAPGVRALLPTDLDLDPGRVLCLLGPSGCGKTTLLRIVAGLEQPDAGGVVRFDGQDVTGLPVEHRDIGMVFQSYALFPNMDVAANVGYGLKVRGAPPHERRARVEEVLSICRLEGLAGRRITALSGGQRQRVALARAVATRPKVLLLDEPLSALDAALREHLRDELAALLRDLSITAIFVTHDQAEAMAIADEVAVMNHGQIEQCAPPERLYRAPGSAFVASFVGGANELHGDVHDDRLALAGGTIALPRPVPPGSRIFVRPETVRLTGPGTAGLHGRVATRTFLGTHVRLSVTGAMTHPLHVVAPADAAPIPGDTVGLDIAANALLIFEED